MPRTHKPKAPPLPALAASERIAALDVSSTCAGFAVVTVAGLVEHFGRAKPPAGWDSVRRIDAISAGLSRELTGLGCSVCVMEWQSHKHAARLKNAQGLAVLGQAQGAVREVMRGFGFIHGVVCISEREWTEGRPKQSRARLVRLLCSNYARWADEHGDDGLDVADAVGLGLWAAGRVPMPGGAGGEDR
jgi:hypothetical protein